MKRQHVHLSKDEETAIKVGSRHGKPAVLIIRSGEMARQKHLFYVSDNGVWLTDNVPVGFITFPT
jgi:putative RNA 2'-phosphotransferase